MNWLIVEDALKNRQGHWVEYVETFRKGLKALDHDVTILADRSAEDFIASQPEVHCVLPHSIWDRMGDNAGRMKRYLRVPAHGWNTMRAMKRWFRSNPTPDIVFVPTVLVHHLIGWLRIYHSVLRQSETKLLLFFPNTPLTHNDQTGQAMLGRDPTARLFGWLIGKFAEGVKSGQVILGVETHAMRDAMSRVTGVDFTYLPHPVAVEETVPSTVKGHQPLHFGSYGAARHEKGSDLLQAAIRKHLDDYPETKSRFSIQWLSDFHDHEGNLISPDPSLVADDRVNYIREYFGEGGYDQQLANTDVMLLPYREPYRYRVSRVVIEAMVRGIPVVATRQTTLWEQTEKFGSGFPCELGDTDSVANAIRRSEENQTLILRKAAKKASIAAQHFSVPHFCDLASSSTPPARSEQAHGVSSGIE